VSRVGGAAQHKAIKKVSGTLRLDLASYRELEAFTQFGSDLDDATKARLDRGERTVEILKQGLHDILPFELQAISIYSLTKGYLDRVKVSEVNRFEKELHDFITRDEAGKKIIKEMKKTKSLPEGDSLDNLLDNFVNDFI